MMLEYGIDPNVRAQKILSKAKSILATVDDSFIITQRHHIARLVPTFRPEEISLGKVLGKGGFGIVHEIAKFTLDPDHHEQDEEEEENKKEIGNDDEVMEQSFPTTTGSTTLVLVQQDHPHHRQDNAKVPLLQQQQNNHPKPVSADDMHVHYDIRQARSYMEQHCQRQGVSRYALKQLHHNLTPLERARGMIDLAVEAKYLSVVWHPNIIKLRGIAQGDIVDRDFFIVLDRLHGTLDGRINAWRREYDQHSAFWCRNNVCSKTNRREVLKSLMIERLTVAYDLAAAFFYLHENRLVYRDIKPENIGFDIRGDVKVFDFGLVKSLSPQLKARGGGYGYRLTGRAGSIPYMAPEVIKMETYDTKVDVYSFAILLWEILALQQCCKNMTPSQFVDRIVVKNERFPIQRSWPPLTRLMMQEAWDVNPSVRPDMKRVAIILRGDLNDMTTDEAVLRRTNHMRNRSSNSLKGFANLDVPED